MGTLAKWFRGGLVFKAHRLVYDSTPGLRVIISMAQIPRMPMAPVPLTKMVPIPQEPVEGRSPGDPGGDDEMMD